MAKLTGAAKQAFLMRINKGRRAKGLSIIKSKSKGVARRVKSIASKVKRPRRTNSPVARRGALPARPRRRDSLKALYDKKTIKQIAIKTALGAGLGIAVKVLGMFSRNQTAALVANRAAPVVAAYAGGGTGELVYQAADFIITRGSINLNGNQIGFTSGGA